MASTRDSPAGAAATASDHHHHHWEDTATSSETAQPPAKRQRVPLACQRCKGRKQKCDGRHPQCSNCRNSGATCEFVIPAKAYPFGKNHYTKALEERIAFLESQLSEVGETEFGRDHWNAGNQHQFAVANGISPPPTAARRTSSTSSVPARPVATVSVGTQTDHYPIPVAQLMPPHLPPPQQQDDLHIVDGVTDLSFKATGLASNPLYIGSSSGYSIARLVQAAVTKKNHGVDVPRHQSMSDAASTEATSPDSAYATDHGNNEFLVDGDHRPMQGFPTDEKLVDLLLNSYFRNSQRRFPLLDPNKLNKLHEDRARLTDQIDVCTLHLAYAIGGRFLETTGKQGNFFPERHFYAAVAHLEYVLELCHIQSAQILALLALYSLRSPSGSVWTLTGMAMRLCIEFGFHRKPASPVRADQIFELELQKRLFWSCYALDRQVSLILGRPFSIADFEVDCELPIDIDDFAENPMAFHARASELAHDRQPAPSNMSSFIHMCRLRRIESKIQRIVYRLDENFHAQDHQIEAVLQELDVWRMQIPRYDPSIPFGEGHDPRAYFLLYYYKCLRVLLQPQLAYTNSSDRLFGLCADACGKVCQTYKLLHQSHPVGYSLMALHSIFIAGITLLYCAWLDRNIYTVAMSNDIRACSTLLFVIAERWPSVRRYRDTFEGLTTVILEHLGSADYQPRTPLDQGRSMTGFLQSIELGHGEGADVSQSIIRHMTTATPTNMQYQGTPGTSATPDHDGGGGGGGGGDGDGVMPHVRDESMQGFLHDMGLENVLGDPSLSDPMWTQMIE